MRPPPWTPVLVVLALALCACGEGATPEASGAAVTPDAVAPTTAPAPTPTPSRTASATPTPSPTASATPTPSRTVSATPTPSRTPAAARPSWLGTRPLPPREDGFGQVLDTPPELVDRRLPPPDSAPPGPAPGTGFEATVGPVPEDVAARSTWSPECPVALDELRYLTVTFWGFDDAAHTGELIVHARVADDLVEVLGVLYEARFPIEEMRVIAPGELDAEPTGDGNTTTGFVCRPAVGSSSWSQHAYGLAVDVNPFHNPYVRDDLVLPELASAYADRSRDRPGMVQPGSVATEAFAAIGWGWGGEWSSARDWMHFRPRGVEPCGRDPHV